MSKISTLIDTLRTDIPLLSGFDDRSELSNPYDLSRNSESELSSGWALVIEGSSEDPGAEFNNTVSRQLFSIALTQEVVRTDEDVEPIYQEIKVLLEDALTLRKYVLKNSIIADLFLRISTSEPTFQVLNSKNYLIIRIQFDGRISEEL